MIGEAAIRRGTGDATVRRVEMASFSSRMAMSLGKPSPPPSGANLQSALAPKSCSARLKSSLKKTVAVAPKAAVIV